MDKAHTCNTTHCIAGWACHVLEGGMELEKVHGWNISGTHFLGISAAKHFFRNNETAKQFLKQYI